MPDEGGGAGECRGDLLGTQPGPVLADWGGQPSSACKFVLVGLANHAGLDGTGTFPSVATLMRYTGLAERTVRTCLGRLEAAGIIWPCDPDVVAARISADRRPKGWDLDLTRVRSDLTETEVAALERQFPGLAARVEASSHPEEGKALCGVQLLHPTGAVDSWADGGSDCTPHLQRGAVSAQTGCSRCTRTVQRTIPRTARRRARGRACQWLGGWWGTGR